MSGSTIEKAMPRVALTRLARKALVPLNLSADAVCAIRDHANDVLSEVMQKVITVAQQSPRKAVSVSELSVIPGINEVEHEDGVKVPVCAHKVFKLDACDKSKNPNCGSDVRQKKAQDEVKYYSSQGNCHLLPKSAFSKLVKAAFERLAKGKKLSSDAVDVLQSLTENVVQKTINAAGQVAASSKKSLIRGEHVHAAVKIMKLHQ
jgi:histone H3/H4